MKLKIICPLAIGLAVGAGTIVLASTLGPAENGRIGNRSDVSGGTRFTIQLDEMDDAGDGDLPLADEAAEEAMSNQNVGSGTVVVPGEGGSDKAAADK